MEETIIETVAESVEVIEQFAAPALLSLDDVLFILISLIPVGVLLGCIIIVVGLGVSGIIKIFKKI